MRKFLLSAVGAAAVLAGTATAEDPWSISGSVALTSNYMWRGITQTLDCHGGTLFVNGSGNTVTAFGTCWAVSVQGSSNTIIADTIVNDVTAYGFNQTVLFHNGDPALIDVGHQLGLGNRLNRIP